MFTGIVEEIGHIKAVKKQTFSQVLVIEASKVLEGTRIGDSIAVNGICLTVTAIGKGQFCADVMHETVRRTSLKNIRAGSLVNLERAMSAGGRFGGHIVSGHIDGTGTVSDIRKDDNAVWYRINADKSILRYVVKKGSITIDGISLTVATVTDKYFEVSVIPHTREVTILGGKRLSDVVNLETDIIAKYVEKLLCPYDGGEAVLNNNNSNIYNQSFNKCSNNIVKMNFSNNNSEFSNNINSNLDNNVNGNDGIKKKNSGITKEFLLENGF